MAPRVACKNSPLATRYFMLSCTVNLDIRNYSTKVKILQPLRSLELFKIVGVWPYPLIISFTVATEFGF